MVLLVSMHCWAQDDTAAASQTAASHKVSAQDEEQLKKVLDGAKLIEAHQPQQAIDGPLTDVVDYYEHAYGNSKDVMYSPRGLKDTLFYLTGAAQHPGPSGKAIAVGKAWAMAYWARGYAYGELGQFAKSRDELEKAVKLAPTDSQYNSELGFAYQRLSDWHRSLAAFEIAEKYAELTGNTPADIGRLKCRGLRGQGYDLVELNRLDDAAQKYYACLHLVPDDQGSLKELGYVRQQLQKQGRQPPAPR
ncbi:tetratricopeptide repeat protein [Dyella sp. GSA-30]|uniref:tetratricopeptide repeat protein n=1 Tax=Dyella sp. GSA-30 TaxID=2994496 RepID=UPI0024924107|nr:tetratricopeptide repeat protein [Dyella sp. GSA-30]BDU19199.1 hypothetical protein DYGSA30_06560 [Dyella sp. GSA-30]